MISYLYYTNTSVSVGKKVFIRKRCEEIILNNSGQIFRIAQFTRMFALDYNSRGEITCHQMHLLRFPGTSTMLRRILAVGFSDISCQVKRIPCGPGMWS